ncbi:hypothetical protein KIN20_025759 [Parelaphostrongylus tenuis]|uniref:Serine/threonine-protein phosphatase n=1 Tax=Parelaphostrongylus tenuis TaxID=148309 RepID=A0AAD5QX57_PARTN|nr:hypothetical protein KIN20_025759 [Parelaphostrongylus tenuis]
MGQSYSEKIRRLMDETNCGVDATRVHSSGGRPHTCWTDVFVKPTEDDCKVMTAKSEGARVLKSKETISKVSNGPDKKEGKSKEGSEEAKAIKSKKEKSIVQTNGVGVKTETKSKEVKGVKEVFENAPIKKSSESIIEEKPQGSQKLEETKEEASVASTQKATSLSPQQIEAVYEIHLILERAMEAMKSSPILLEVRCPVNICGDIHGQYGDLMRIFNACGLPFKQRYLFLGDYVDRGRHSLEVILLLLALRIQFPRKVYLLRGNHELSNINRVYGFNAEIRQRYRNLAESKALYDHFNEVFAQMPLAAIVSGRILCMHGGLSPNLNSLDDIRKLQRPLRVVRGLAQDLLWADPETGTKGFQQNKIRAVSHIFGEDMVRDKCKQLNIDLIIRAHQVVEFGYAFFCGRSLITVFSAARYHEELVNYAAVVRV